MFGLGCWTHEKRGRHHLHFPNLLIIIKTFLIIYLESWIVGLKPSCNVINMPTKKHSFNIRVICLVEPEKSLFSVW